MCNKLIVFISVLLLSVEITSAQVSATQLWTDFIINVPLKNNYTFSNEFSYKTELTNSQQRWGSFDLSPEIEKSFSKHVDAVFSIGSSYTRQQDAYDTWELKPGLGVRYHFTPDKKVLLRVFARFEQRNMYTIKSYDWDHDFRTRLRLESVFFLNGKTFSANKVWYGIADAEAFWTIDKKVQERYSNRSRIRAGVGYKLSKSWRFEGIYTYQFSRNTIEGELDDNQQQIFRIRFKYFTK